MSTKFIFVLGFTLGSHAFAESGECRKCEPAQRSGLVICAADPNLGSGEFYSPEDPQTALTLKRNFQFAREAFEHAGKLPSNTSIGVRSYAARDGGLKNQEAFANAAYECARVRKIAEQNCAQSCPCIVCEALKKREAQYRNDSAAWGKIAADYSQSSMSDEDAKAREQASAQEISAAYEEIGGKFRDVASTKKLYGPFRQSPNVEDRTH